jgi:hypothetical protein
MYWSNHSKRQKGCCQVFEKRVQQLGYTNQELNKYVNVVFVNLRLEF